MTEANRDKHIDIPESEMGMSGYSTFAWKLWEKGLCTMAEAEKADQIMRQLGYRKDSDVVIEIFEEIAKIIQKYDKIAERDKSEYGELIIMDIGCAIGELKKKYTEGKEYAVHLSKKIEG